MFVLCCLQTQIANAMVASIYQHEISKAAGMTSANQLPPHPLPPAPQTAADLDPRYTQELVANIYRQELTKLAVKAEQCGNYAERDAYRRQLDKLAADAEAAADCRRGRLRPGDDDISGGGGGRVHIKQEENKENLADNNNQERKFPTAAAASRVKTEGGLTSRRADSELSSGSEHPQDLRINTASLDDERTCSHNGSAFSLVRPKSPPADSNHHHRQRQLSPVSNSSSGIPATVAAAKSTSSSNAAGTTPHDDLSPLQQMQSIANSLMTKSGGGASTHGQRPLKAVLPPISQDVFDRYATINTDELVKRVKETLSQYSISQRLFGENVLGLSQGSVSDLLARPKPWHMLTQKGREPFIRMQVSSSSMLWSAP